MLLIPSPRRCSLGLVLLVLLLLSPSFSFFIQPKFVSKTFQVSDLRFANVLFSPPLSSAIERLGIRSSPSPIQSSSIGPIYNGASCIVHAPTGSGKTFAFLLPILQKIFSGNRNRSFQAMVVVPTKELVYQVK